jgi:hypothetical protein
MIAFIGWRKAAARRRIERRRAPSLRDLAVGRRRRAIPHNTDLTPGRPTPGRPEGEDRRYERNGADVPCCRVSVRGAARRAGRR